MNDGLIFAYIIGIILIPALVFSGIFLIDLILDNLFLLIRKRRNKKS